jgi:hypothetical protein
MRARRRFEERKRRLQRINEIYNDWNNCRWDGKYIYYNYWWRGNTRVSYWHNMRMGETGHSAWVHTFMTKPHRTEANRLVRSITAGRIEPDEALFPVWGKPWIYYW